MKANKFPGNMMKSLGIKSWCQLGVITIGALTLLVMGLHGWSLDWNGPLKAPGLSTVGVIWNFICVIIAVFGVVIGASASIIALGLGCRAGAINGWAWARDNCEQINYEDD